jgi:hypothetical protein
MGRFDIRPPAEDQCMQFSREEGAMLVPRRSPRRAMVVIAALALAVFLPAPTSASVSYLTPQPPFITLDPSAPPGSSVLAIINSGDQLGSFKFEGIPDGIGLAPGPRGDVYAFINHEQSEVPFLGQADFSDSTVSQLLLDAGTGEVLDALVPIRSTAGFLRLCSSFMAGPAEGFSTYTYFTNEETNDIVDVPPGAPYGSDPSVAPLRQGGYAVVLNTETRAYDVVPGMGRHNHENSMVLPGGWSDIAVLSGDDTFSAPSSQLYMYLAGSEADIWADTGTLWAFQVTTKNGVPVNPSDPFNGANDYGDIALGDELAGRFIRVPDAIARGLTGTAPQTALENWSNRRNIFQFIRIEDTTYDRNSPHVMYLADTGEPRAIPNPATGRLMRGPSGTMGPYPNGRIFRMEFNELNPKRVVSFTILLNNDLGGYSNPSVMHQPDNMDASPLSLMVQEDSSQAPNSRVWRYDFATQTWSVVASVNDPAWESSGIVDASEWFGEGAWLLDVQGHGDFVDSFTDPNGILIKRESGQLLLMVLPGTTDA